jgi:cytochrome oxidase Cu insertion factor (SCO1/SenC/PrrC family)
MDHSAIIYLMSSEEKFVTVIPYQEDDNSALAKLESLVATAPTS